MSELGEIGAIRRILRVLEPVIPEKPCLPIEDDVQAFDDCKLAVKIDGYSERMSRYPWERMSDWGWRAVTGPVSDLSAKGYKAIEMVYSLGVPKDEDIRRIEELVFGIREALKSYGVQFLGGDLNSSSGEIWIDVAMVGKLISTSPVPRSGAKPGDKVYTTLVNGYGKPGLLYKLYQTASWKNASPRLLRFRPRAVTSFPKIISVISVSSAIDSSDGLAKSLKLLAESSGVSIEIKKLPISNHMRAVLKKYEVSIEEATLFGGEEYEVIFTTKEPQDRVIQACHNERIKCVEIGEVLSGSGEVLYKGKKIAGIGWDHFISP